MNSRIILGLAGLLLAGAMVAGYQGVQLSRQLDRAASVPVAASAPNTLTVPAPASATPVAATEPKEQGTPVLVLARALLPFEQITAEHLAVEHLKIAPPASFSDEKQVLGRHVWQHLPAGTVLSAPAFKAGGPLARLIGKNERALAIAIDEVSGGGGFIQPGDYVDVLLYLRKSDVNSDQTAQVVVPALRVLSVGEELSVNAHGHPIQWPAQASEKTSSQRRRPAQTAVLAIPETLTTRFMLAAQAGKLQLAVRSADEQRLADYFKHGIKDDELKEIERRLFQFAALASRQAQSPRPSGTARRSAGVPVYRGPDVSRQLP